eukprot:gene804-biopygen7749
MLVALIGSCPSHHWQSSGRGPWDCLLSAESFDNGKTTFLRLTELVNGRGEVSKGRPLPLLVTLRVTLFTQAACPCFVELVKWRCATVETQCQNVDVLCDQCHFVVVLHGGIIDVQQFHSNAAPHVGALRRDRPFRALQQNRGAAEPLLVGPFPVQPPAHPRLERATSQRHSHLDGSGVVSMGR